MATREVLIHLNIDVPDDVDPDQAARDYCDRHGITDDVALIDPQ